MTDLEMMELAALAAGYVVESYEASGAAWVYPKGAPLNSDDEPPIFLWNPRDDDGDSRRLEVALRLDVCWPPDDSSSVAVWVEALGEFIEEPFGSDPYAATRLAVLRAAAEVGKRMRENAA